jgi:hypothetical protein
MGTADPGLFQAPAEFHKDRMNNPGRSRERDSSPRLALRGAVTVPIHLFILLGLGIAFSFTSAHAVRSLHPAFKAAYLSKPYTGIEHQAQNAAVFDGSSILHVDYFSPQVLRWESDILSWASQTGLPPDLIAIVMQIESCGDRLARSSAGAMGIFQVMPFHFGTDEDPYDPQVNARRGLAYLESGYLKSAGRIDLTLAGYNGGHSMIDADPDDWPEETKRYVFWGLGLWEDIQSSQYPSPTLEHWFAAGGAHLCSSAAAGMSGESGAN